METQIQEVDQSPLANPKSILFVLAGFNQTEPVKINEFKTLYGEYLVSQLSSATQYRGGMAIYSCNQQDKDAYFIGHEHLHHYLESTSTGDFPCELIMADLPEFDEAATKHLIKLAEKHNSMVIIRPFEKPPQTE